jgi:hypothetical protein
LIAGAAIAHEHAQAALIVLSDTRSDSRCVRRLGARDFDRNDMAVAIALNCGDVADDNAIVAAHFAADNRVGKILCGGHSRRGDREGKNQGSQHRRFHGLPRGLFRSGEP